MALRWLTGFRNLQHDRDGSSLCQMFGVNKLFGLAGLRSRQPPSLRQLILNTRRLAYQLNGQTRGPWRGPRNIAVPRTFSSWKS